MLAGVLDRDRHHAARLIEVEIHILRKLTCFGHIRSADFDQRRVGVFEVADFNDVGSRYERSKKALCTVRPSSKRITRSTLPCISGMVFQTRFRPSD